MVYETMAASGSKLPQVSDDGTGSLSGTLHIVTTDGAGPYEAMIDPTASGLFAEGTPAEVTTQVPGNQGEIRPDGTVPGEQEQALQDPGTGLLRRGLSKRANNVDIDYPIAVAIPAGTTCQGTAGTESNVCFVKIANSNPAGPFGGVIAFQMVKGNSTTSATAAASSTASTSTSSSSTEGEGEDGENGEDQEGEGEDQQGQDQQQGEDQQGEDQEGEDQEGENQEGEDQQQGLEKKRAAAFRA